MAFICSYCQTEFIEYHHDTECRDVLLHNIYKALNNLNRHLLKMILNYINFISV